VSALDLPEGLTSRTATRDDAGAVLRLIEIAEDHYDGAVEVDAADLESDFQRVGFDLGRDCVLVFDGDDAVAWCNVYKERAEGDVRPSHQRRGIGTALVRWSETHSLELRGAKVTQSITDNNGDARELFLGNGYAPTETAWILQISFDGPPPEQPIPDGVSIRPYDDADARPVHRLIDDAFSEWEGRDPMTFEEWRVFIIDHKAFSSRLSRLAFAGDELVGATLSFDYDIEDEGWIQQVATKATHRHRGIARALLYETFRAFYDDGQSTCGLSTESRTGALALYEKVGMHVRRSYTKYTKPLV
jgi:mycothiol synthase